MPVCARCGTGVPFGHAFCHECGLPIPEVDAVESSEAPSPAGVGPAGDLDPASDTAAAPPGWAPMSPAPAGRGDGHALPVATETLPQNWPPRAAAAIIDVGLVFIAWAFLLGTWLVASGRIDTAHPSAVTLEAGEQLVWILLFALLFYVYLTLAESFTGRTLGKVVVRLRVVGADGARCPWSAAARRNLTKAGVVLLLGVLPLGLAALPAAVVSVVLVQRDERCRRRLGDRLADTQVVKIVNWPMAGGAPPEGGGTDAGL